MRKDAKKNDTFSRAKAGKMKEEISMELAELGNMTPKQEPMTPNERDKSEKEKWYG